MHRTFRGNRWIADVSSAPAPTRAELSALMADPAEARALRELAAHLGAGIPAQTDEMVVSIVHRAVTDGRVRLSLLGPRRRYGEAARSDEALLPAAPVSPADSRVHEDLDHWIEVVLVDERGTGIPGQRCVITTSDACVHSRYTDSLGCVRLDRIPAGTCEVSYPDLDADAWSSLEPS